MCAFSERESSKREYRVVRGRYGQVLVDSGEGSTGFVASFVDGRWTADMLFEVYELHYDFWRVRDVNEAQALFEQARHAVLSQEITLE